MSLHKRRKFHSLLALAVTPVIFATFLAPTVEAVGGSREEIRSHTAVGAATTQQNETNDEEKSGSEATPEGNEDYQTEVTDDHAGEVKDNESLKNSSPLVQASLTRIDKLGDKAKVGDTVRFRFTFRNVSRRQVTVYPYESTLRDVVVGQTPARNCRWFGLRPGRERSCNFGYHILTEKDVATAFTPTITYKLTDDRAGTQVLEGQTKFTVSAQSIRALPLPDIELNNLEDGQGVTLARTIDRTDVCYRIPALTTANNGDVLAAWDYRPGSCADSPNPNSIALRVWKKGSDNFTEQRIIAQGATGKEKKGYSDPSFVVDRETGDIFMFSVLSYDAGLNQSRPGVDPADRRVIHANLMVSRDNGETWEDRGNITQQITNDPSWRARFATSGEGIQIKNGPYAGRLIQQYAIHNDVSPRFQAVSVYSDDHGKTWKAGNPVGANMDENKIVELADGTLMLNSRISSGAVKGRKVSYSTDGGVNWSEPVDDTNLTDPHNNASIIRAFPETQETDSRSKILLFSNANSTSGRHNGTVRVSVDNGKTWSKGKVFSGSSSAEMQYSTMTKISDGVFGILYEAAGPSITFSKFSTSWLGKFVHFVCAEGTDCPTSQFIEDDGVSTEPTVPTREGYTFAGWKIAGTQTPFVFGSSLTSDVVLEASWTPIQQSASVSVSLERIDALGEDVRVGDVLYYQLTFTNNGSRQVAFVPTSSTLNNVAITEQKSCRWGKLGAGETQKCSFGLHIVSQEDTARAFVPSVTYTISSDPEGRKPLDGQKDRVVTSASVQAVGTAYGPEELPENRSLVLAHTGDRPELCYRIPALTVANNGDVLAAWDYRPGPKTAVCPDAPNPNSIVVRVWKKGTNEFTESQVIVQGKEGEDKYGYSDPSFVVDRETGDIFMFSVLSYDVGFGKSVVGTNPAARNVLHANVAVSHDNGKTWQDKGNITAQITKDSSWRTRFAASGQGIQISKGAYKGRLLQQYTIRYGSQQAAVTVYSDDHGTTWKAGNPVGKGMDENKVVELADGRLMLNSRSSSDMRARWVAYSEDGGENWSEPVADTNLTDPRNNASIIRAYPEAPEWDSRSHILLFSNANSAVARKNGTVRVSLDDGATWDSGRLFSDHPEIGMDYSTLTHMGEGKFALLYETQGWMLNFKKFAMPWLGNYVHYVCSEGVICPSSQRVEDNGVSLAPETPIREGYTFTGWVEKEKPYTFGQAVKGEVILEATWKKEVTQAVFPSVTPKGANVFVLGDKEITYGRPGDKPIVGDWDGDGVATPGVIRGNKVFLSNTLQGGNADIVFIYGRVGDTAIVGDWNGNGIETLALRRGNTVYVKNSLSGGYADETFTYGRAGDEVFAGDWDGDGKDTLALRRGTTIYQSNRLGGPADLSFSLGEVGDIPIAGRFTTGQHNDTISLIRNGQLHVKSSSGTDERIVPLPPASSYLVASTGKNSTDTVVAYGVKK